MNKSKKISLSLMLEGFVIGILIEGFIDITYSHIRIIQHLSPFILLTFSALMVFLGILVIFIFINNVIKNIKVNRPSYLLLFFIYDLSIIFGGYIIRIILSI